MRRDGNAPVTKTISVGDQISLSLGGERRTLEVATVADFAPQITEIDTSAGPSHFVLVTARDVNDVSATTGAFRDGTRAGRCSRCRRTRTDGRSKFNSRFGVALFRCRCLTDSSRLTTGAAALSWKNPPVGPSAGERREPDGRLSALLGRPRRFASTHVGPDPPG